MLGSMYMQMDGKESEGRQLIEKMLHEDVHINFEEVQENAGMLDYLRESARNFLKRIGKSSKASMRSVCGFCEAESKAEFRTCNACGKIAYCSNECQKADWSRHKEVCTFVPLKKRNKKNIAENPI